MKPVNNNFPKIETLELQLQLLGTPQATTVQWNNVALDCLKIAENFLNNRYDYRSAITWFTRAVTLYEKELFSPNEKSLAAQAYVGLALSYHNVGRHDQRDLAMAKAQHILKIPDAIDSYTQELFDRSASNYFVVDGYRFYINYENSHKNAVSLDQQEEYLHKAKASFLKALEIADEYDLHEEKAHATHGLGTMFEFLSKCQLERHNEALAKTYLQQSVAAFEQSLSMRQHILGENHPHVARSYHKLARNYALLGALSKNEDTQETKELLQKADSYYQKALSIFEKNSIPAEQIKRQELEQEYEKFKAKLNDKLH